MFWAQLTTKVYIRAENKLQSISITFIPQVIIPQVSFSQTMIQILSTISERKPTKTKRCFGAYSYFAGTQHGNLYSAGWPILFCGSTQKPVLITANTGKTRERFWKNAGEWTGRVEIKQERPGSSRSMHGYILAYSQALKENLWAPSSPQQMGP